VLVSPKPAALALALALLAVAASSAGAKGPAPSPRALYSALLTTAYPNSQLPSGFTFATVSSRHPSARQSRTYHVVGEVVVDVHGQDRNDGITYWVFPDTADARADLTHLALGNGVRITGKVPGYSLPSVAIAGSTTFKNALGESVSADMIGLFVVSGNVEVAAAVTSLDDKSGGTAKALALLKSALRHLDTLRG
jgi:hypothetical protein